MRRPTKPVYRPNDIVEIVEPLVVNRVGYPLTPALIRDEIKQLCRAEIDALLVKAGLNPSVYVSPGWLDEDCVHEDSSVFADVLTKLCYHVVAARRFGGDTRSIHTELREDLRGRRCRVLSKRNVKTGVHYCASATMDYWGAYDYEPGGLSNCRTHVLLECQLIGDGTIMGWADPFEIEACHVKAETLVPVAESESA